MDAVNFILELIKSVEPSLVIPSIIIIALAWAVQWIWGKYDALRVEAAQTIKELQADLRELNSNYSESNNKTAESNNKTADTMDKITGAMIKLAEMMGKR